MDNQQENNTPNFAPKATEQTAAPAPSSKGSSGTLYVALGLIVIALIAGAFFLSGEDKEKKGSSEIAANGLANDAVIAVVNGTEISNANLSTSMVQISATAAVQGIDTTTPEVQDEIEARAVEVLVNTELLEQAAAERGIVVTDATVQTRLGELSAELGGEEVLKSRLDELGLNDDTLEEDIRSELTIQILLDEIFVDADLSVSDEEITAAYEAAGGAEAGLPAIADVREQLEFQVRTTKEQTLLDAFISELRAGADIEVLI